MDKMNTITRTQFARVEKKLDILEKKLDFIIDHTIDSVEIQESYLYLVKKLAKINEAKN